MDQFRLYPLDLPHIIMLLLAFALIYLAIVKQFEPLVLLPIAFGILLANLPITGIMAEPVDGAPGGLLTIFTKVSSLASIRP